MESVWDYPQGPAFEAERRPVRVEHGGVVVAETTEAIRVLERGLPPSYYIRPEHVRTDLLVRCEATSLCPVKGHAAYWTVRLGDQEEAARAAWSYPDPLAMAEPIRGYFCFDVNRVERCLLGGEPARGRDNPFYGGWVTSDIQGPFLGDDLPEHLVKLLPRPVISPDADESFEDVAARSVIVGQRYLPPAL